MESINTTKMASSSSSSSSSGHDTINEVIDIMDDDDEVEVVVEVRENENNETNTTSSLLATSSPDGVIDLCNEDNEDRKSNVATIDNIHNANNNQTKKRKRQRQRQCGNNKGTNISTKIDVVELDIVNTCHDGTLAVTATASSASTTLRNDQLYKQSLGPLRMEFISTFGGNTTHAFLKENNVSQNNSTIRYNQSILYKEIIEYKLNLPAEASSAIFVRVLESRLDLLRVLITGPVNTPYQNGCFLFDIYLPDYPSVAPKVQFLTTGYGTVRFNPNLYNCGKVCLSLLGTWTGPGWIRNTSTLLQVLISIQGLILGVQEPYYNEPGYENHKNDIQSKLYNRKIRQYTLQYGIVDHLNQLLGIGKISPLSFPTQGVIVSNPIALQQAPCKSFSTSTNAAAIGTSSSSDTTTTPPPTRTTSITYHGDYYSEFSEIMTRHFTSSAVRTSIQQQLTVWLSEDPSLSLLVNDLLSKLDLLSSLRQTEEQLQQIQKHNDSIICLL